MTAQMSIVARRRGETSLAGTMATLVHDIDQRLVLASAAITRRCDRVGPDASAHTRDHLRRHGARGTAAGIDGHLRRDGVYRGTQASGARHSSRARGSTRARRPDGLQAGHVARGRWPGHWPRAGDRRRAGALCLLLRTCPPLTCRLFSGPWRSSSRSAPRRPSCRPGRPLARDGGARFKRTERHAFAREPRSVTPPRGPRRDPLSCVAPRRR